MAKDKEDLRVRRTKKTLQDAFIKLVAERGFKAVTVQMLANEAMVNRATFYRHFEDKYDLAEKAYGQIAADYAALIRSNRVENGQDIYSLMFEHVAAYSQFYRVMMRTMPQIQDWIMQSTEELMRSVAIELEMKTEEMSMPPEIVFRYLSAANIGVLLWWLEAGQPIPPKKMAQYIEELHLEGGLHALKMKKLLVEFIENPGENPPNER